MSTNGCVFAQFSRTSTDSHTARIVNLETTTLCWLISIRGVRGANRQDFQLTIPIKKKNSLYETRSSSDVNFATAIEYRYKILTYSNSRVLLLLAANGRPSTPLSRLRGIVRRKPNECGIIKGMIFYLINTRKDQCRNEWDKSNFTGFFYQNIIFIYLL